MKAFARRTNTRFGRRTLTVLTWSSDLSAAPSAAVKTAAGDRVHVVLVGAGHAHLHLLHRAAELRRARIDLTLVAPPRFHYSGLATGVLSGDVAPAEATIDVEALARAAKVAFRPGRVTGVDRERRRLILDEGETLAFDAACLNIGSETSDAPFGRAGTPVWRVKPLTQLFELREALTQAARAAGAAPAVVVAGGGPSGFEVAAAAAGLMERQGLRPRVVLVAKAAPAWGPPAALDRLRRSLTARGVTLIQGEAVGVSDAACHLADGRRLPCDHLVWATGLRPPPLIGALGLPVAADGRLRVDPTLRSIADPAIFAVGDCAIVDGAPRPPLGVFGVRAAPILLNNLAALGDGRPLRAFRPQTRWLSIMDLGDGRALAMRGRFWSLGRPALALKRYLDFGFIRRMRAPSKEVSP